MKKNTKITRQLLCILTAGILLCWAPACGTFNKGILNKQEQFASRQAADNESSRTLIPDYSGMKEDDMVSAFWAESGFTMHACRQIKVYPVINYTRVEYPWAEKKLEKALQEIFTFKGNENARIDAGVIVAIVGIVPKMKLLKRFSPAFDDYPSIEVEIMIIDESTKKPLCKVCHVGRDEKDFKNALDSLVKDLKLFFEKKI